MTSKPINLPFWNIYWTPETTSTNDLARQAIQNHPVPWKIFLANRQTKGRGRKGRTWTSKAGKGLLMSIIIPLTDELKPYTTLIPIMAGISCAEAIEWVCSLPQHSVHIKWPNDIFMSRGKLGGILCELVECQSGKYVICGIGINLTEHPSAMPDNRQATDLLLETNQTVPPGRLVGPIRQSLMCLCQSGYDEISKKFTKRDMLYNRPVTVQEPALSSGESPQGQISGVAMGIDTKGALLLNCAGNTINILSGTVIHIGERQE